MVVAAAPVVVVGVGAADGGGRRLCFVGTSVSSSHNNGGIVLPVSVCRWELSCRQLVRVSLSHSECVFACIRLCVCK